MSGLCDEFRATALRPLPLNDDSVHAICWAVAGFYTECAHIHACVADITVYEMCTDVEGAFERQASGLWGAFICPACKGLQLDPQAIIFIQAAGKFIERGFCGIRQVG